MFTGIIETLGKVVSLDRKGSNLDIVLECDIALELKVDQSVAHNGVCLTVTHVSANQYSVTAIEETLQKTNLGKLTVGDKVNLERCMPLNGRLDGHIVQGHVDQTGVCVSKTAHDGSWVYDIEYDLSAGNVTVEKGSICLNGISLTVFNSTANGFSVAIIPYTYEHTNMHSLEPGDTVNLEFDIIGKYVARLLHK